MVIATPVVMVAITVAFVLAVVTVAIAVPVVIMLETPAVSLPVTHIESFAVVARWDPASSFVRRASPIALMPPVVPANGIPITLHP